jgi:hypothetical protein
VTAEKKQALDGTRLNAFAMAPEVLYLVGLDGDEGEEHALWDERVLMAVAVEDVDNVMMYGVLEPVICRKVRLPDGTWRTEVVAGRQRVKWARAANQRFIEAGSNERIRVPVMLNKSDEKHQAGIIEAENGVRVTDGPLVKARKAQRLMARSLLSEKEVAITMGVTRESVRQWLVLLSLSPKLQKAVEDSVMTASAAIAFNDLSHDEQEQRLAQAEALGITITTPEARRQRVERASNPSKSKGQGTLVARTVSSGTLRKLVDHEEFMASLSSDARFLLRFISGEAGMDTKVKGLRKVLREIGAIKSKQDDSDAAAE